MDFYTSEDKLEKVKELLEHKVGLKNFLVEDFIGEGSFGKVVKAKLKNNPAKGLEYAVKVILVDKDNTHGVAEKKFIENLYARVKKCCPACVVNIYPEFLREGLIGSYWKEFYYLVVVSDFIPQTLANFKGSPEEVLKIGVRLGECMLQFLENGLVYTDLKPQNVGVSPDSHPLILDFGGFKDLERVVKLSLTLSRSSVKLFTPLYSPPEFINALHLGRARSYFEKELKEGKGTTYQLAATLIEPLTGSSFDLKTHKGIYSLTSYIEDPHLRELFQKALSQNREERPTLEEFLKELQKKFYALSISLEEEVREIVVLKDLKVRASQKVELKNRTYLVTTDVKIEPKGELIIKNANLLFEEGAGIVGKDCTFIAETSVFQPLKEGWKNITLGGNLKGYIKNCTFKGGRGRRGEEINKLLEVNYSKEKTFGGALFIRANKTFSVENCNFESCSAYYGGSIFADRVFIKTSYFKSCISFWEGGGLYIENSNITQCLIENCVSENGGGIFAYENVSIENGQFVNCSANKEGGGFKGIFNSRITKCEFKNCKAENGGGLFAYENISVETSLFRRCQASKEGGGVKGIFKTHISSCKFESCLSKKGGGIFAYENLSIENCTFKNCFAEETGGAIYCVLSNSFITKNVFKNCQPNGVEENCKERS